MLIERLCNAHGVSGDEGVVRNIIKSEIEMYVDSMSTDMLGNLIAFKKGKSSDKKIMLSAHMDEVGFIISGISDKGYLKFKTVGGIDTRVIFGKRVVLQSGIKGIIGVKAVHLLSESERDSVPKEKDVYIDIGASSKEEAEKYVSIGDYVAFDTVFERLGGSRIKAKAIDDRAGCAALVEVLKSDCEFDLYACFTTQEEVGLRGSAVCAESIKPDAALVLESTTCSDVYTSKPWEEVSVCGGGVTLSFMDSRTIADKKYLDSLMEMAEVNNIKHQLKKVATGGTDAGSIHLAAGGCPCVSAAVPCRYLHSPACVADLKDLEALTEFAKVYIREIGGIMKWNCSKD